MNPEIYVPFQLNKVYNGIAEGDGILRWDGSKIIIEYQVKDSIFGVIKSSIKRFGLRVDDLQDINVTKNFFSCFICLKSISLYTFNNFPGRQMNEIKLKLRKSDFEDARCICSAVQLAISERRLNNMMEG
jgi:hypothetical protein